MNRFRVPILGLMAIVAAFGMAFAAVKSGSDLWFGAFYTFTVFGLMVAVVAAKYRRRAERAFWFGFAVFGWSFFLLGIGRFESPIQNEDSLYRVNESLFTTKLVIWLMPYLRGEITDIDQIRDSTETAIAISHLCVTIVVGLFGGLLAVWLRGRGRNASPADLPKFGKKGIIAASVVLLLGVALINWISRPSPVVAYFLDKEIVTPVALSAVTPKHPSRVLSAMSEPPLWKTAESNKDKIVYRFLYLPSFQHPMSIRFERLADGGQLHATVLDGKGGYDPGIVAIRRTVKLTERQWQEFDSYLARPSFWTLPQRDLAGLGGTDGNSLFVEGISDGKYHWVSRVSLDSHDSFWELADFMFTLSGLNENGKIEL